MLTPIGEAFANRPARLAMSGVVAASAVAIDLILAWHYVSFALRALVVLGAIAFLLVLTQGHFASLGLRSRPIQGYAYWIRVTAFIALGMALLLGAALGVWMLLGHDLPVYKTAPAAFWSSFVHMCILAPLVEEALYRFVVCVSAVRVLKYWGAIVLSGALFAALHVAYGNPSPENAIGGFVLAWAYLKSGSIVVPIVWHMFGNLAVLFSQLGAWYLL